MRRQLARKESMNPMPKPTTPNTPLTRRALLHTGAGICATAAGAVLLSACSSSDDSLAKQANSGDNKGYIAGDGSVTEYQEAERGDPVAFTGELFDGKLSPPNPCAVNRYC